MCGFVGWINRDPEQPVDPRILRTMNRTLSHRGPDDEGYFTHGNMGMAHRRLSIIDISANGRQPLYNEDKSIIVVANGEIYNYLELKNILENHGHRFSSQSDNEVIVHGYEKWGIELFNRLDGMFSIAIYDKSRQKMVISRDPFGKKPLYYACQNGMFLFASELKAFSKNPHFKRALDPLAIQKYFIHDYVPTPHTILSDCYKLPRACYMIIDSQNITAYPKPVPYWQISYEPKRSLSLEESCEQFEYLFKQAVQKRLMSDVPLGIFLSGGLDSSAILSTVEDITGNHNTRTFTIGFKEKSFDESNQARTTANCFNATHYEKVLQSDTMLDILPRVIDKLDEPLADPSILPTFQLCHFAKKEITVALGGDGGDELLAGYDPFLAMRFSHLVEAAPECLISYLKTASRYLPTSHRNMAFPYIIKHFLKGFPAYGKGSIELRNSHWLGAFTPETLGHLLKKNGTKLPHWETLYAETITHEKNSKALRTVDKLIDNYINLYLHDDILVKIDRASMMNSLEVRSPFLDKNLAEFISRLPPEIKMRGVTRKYLLKKTFHKKLPPFLLNKSKKGFGIPISAWFRKQLKPMLLETLLSNEIHQYGLFNPAYVKKLVTQHLTGREDNRKEIWNLFLFELWRKAHQL